MFMYGNTMSREPHMSGMSRLPKPPRNSAVSR